MSKLRKSLVFSMADTYVGLPLQIIGTMLLSRLLTPAETGVFAVAAVFSAFASTFRDFGVGDYLIQEAELTDTKLRAALTVNIIISWFMGLMLFVLAPLAASFYRHPGIADVMRVQCLSFLLIPFGAVTMGYFRRELNFRPIFMAGLFSNIASFVVGAACALQGQAYMSLAWGALAGVVATVGTALWFRPRDFPQWPGLEGIGPVFHFGKFASGVNIFGQMGRGAPEMIIGRAQGLAEVALFSRAGGLVELFNRLVLRGVVPVCQPYFAKGHREQGSVVQGYGLSLSFLTAVGWPVLMFLALASFPVLRILYGVQWVAAVGLAQVLCAAMAIELVHYLSKEALLAAGEARRASELQVLTQVVRVLGLLGVVPFGLMGACWGMLGAAAVGLLISQRAMGQVVGWRWADLITSCRPSALVTLGTALPLGLLYGLVSPGEHNYIWWLAAASVLFAVTWLVSLRAVGHPAWPELATIAKRLRARVRPASVLP